MQYSIRSLLLLLSTLAMVGISASEKKLTQAEFDAKYPLVRPLVHDELKLLGWTQQEVESVELQISKKEHQFASLTENNKQIILVPSYTNDRIALGNRKTILELRAILGHEGGHLAHRDTARLQAFNLKLCLALSIASLYGIKKRSIKVLSTTGITAAYGAPIGNLAYHRHL